MLYNVTASEFSINRRGGDQGIWGKGSAFPQEVTAHYDYYRDERQEGLGPYGS